MIEDGEPRKPNLLRSVSSRGSVAFVSVASTTHATSPRGYPPQSPGLVTSPQVVYFRFTGRGQWMNLAAMSSGSVVTSSIAMVGSFIIFNSSMDHS